MTAYPPPSGPPRDPAPLRRQASTALTGAILLWVLVGLMILGTIGRAASASTTPAPSSGAEAFGRLVGMIGLPIAAAVGAVLLHRRRARLLRQAHAIQSFGQVAPGYPTPGHLARVYPPPNSPYGQGFHPNYPPPGHWPPPNHLSPSQHRPDSQ
ncbi:hypothetical protein GIY30_08620 [Gordonia sp. HNM0687]|uniref:Uncharacterized protein n=1 Tax=Gordonia mangrovi TaxID=2665643 RepID=A0A6L7GP67_9ACTN|nr:hypothetical protein [Gordonia mangrovi]MXP21412.1 hypothetical protein [Gordonia mangrovi]UVF80161.1 hypothetical protein NWF22_10195 [Gordonia mangrovi]